MKSKKSNPEIGKPPFTGCVETVPPPTTFIEFVTDRRLWGIPSRQLESFILGGNSEAEGQKTSPTDLLVLVYQTRLVFLFGWRLEQLLDPLIHGRIKRLHAEKHLGALMIGEPWIAEIVIVPRFADVPL